MQRERPTTGLLRLSNLTLTSTLKFVISKVALGEISGPKQEYAPCTRYHIYSSKRHIRPLKPGVHTNDFAPIYGRRAKKLGHASLATVIRHGRLTFQPILWENLDSPVLRYQPITTAVITDACLNTRWHHGAYTSAVLREPLGVDRVVTVRGSVGPMNADLWRPDGFATVQSGR